MQDENGVVPHRSVPEASVLIGREVPSSAGCLQQGMQCYAAAMATACNWASGISLTTDEAMHLFLTSPNGTTDAAAAYRTAFLETTRMLDSDGGDVTFIHEVMSVQHGHVLEAARGSEGEPIFPDGLAHSYHSRITGELLKGALHQGGVVMLASHRHWTVVYGCEVGSDGRVTFVYEFDPMNNTYLPASWNGSREGVVPGYVVGGSSG